MKVVQSCPTLCNPIDYTAHGIVQARTLEWVAFPFSRGSSQCGDQTQASHTAGRFFTSWATREAQEHWTESLLKQIFLTQESNWGPLNCRWYLYQLSYWDPWSQRVGPDWGTELNSYVDIVCRRGFSHSSVGKISACNAGDPGSVPGLGSSHGEGIGYPLQYSWASLVTQMIKNLPAMVETWVWTLNWEDPLEESMATHSSILAWRIPMNRGAHRATDCGSRGVGHD